MNAAGSFPVKPAVGFALSYGESRLIWNYFKMQSESIDGPVITDSRYQLRHSKDNLGTMLEFGFLIRTTNSIELSIMTQVHRFESDFGDDHNEDTQDRYVVLMPSMQISMQYLFPFLSLGK